jgi:NAD(P)-dependent dehydrogenase (short-subunit alcohol dehydrogenase family)
MRGLRGKRIIVASGATGIGAATAMRLADEGACVLVGDINEAGLQSTVGKIVAAGGTAQGSVFDLKDEASIEKMVDTCFQVYGGIDGLANIGADTKGAAAEMDKDICQLDIAHWDKTLRTNLLGHMLTIRAAIPHLVKSGGGAVVCISSGAAFNAQPNIPAYASSKAALHPLIRHVAKRWGKDNIRCNGVAPGWVMSEMGAATFKKQELENALRNHALNRLGTPEDIAAMTAFLLSDDAAWITGQVISVNGGTWFRD